jgi:hypothetical protein
VQAVDRVFSPPMNISLDACDSLRSLVFRLTLSHQRLRRILLSRSLRLQWLFLLAVSLYLPLALFFPLLVLVIGPIIYGIPHLFASLRFIHFSISSPVQLTNTKLKFRSFHFLAAVWIVILAARLLYDHGALPLQWPSSGPEILGLAVAAIGLWSIYGKNAGSLARSVAVVLPLAFLLWNFPLWTSGLLILLHNWVAFAYWHLACKSQAERRVVLVSAFIFLVVHLLVFWGAFDGVYLLASPQGYLRWAQLDYADLGRLIAPWSSNYQLLFHCVVLYAFGQAMHYFIWLKAIPDQNHTNEVPASFRTSYRLLIQDLGHTTTRALILVSVISAGVWLMAALPAARELYFAFAAFHGFAEIGALTLARS